MGAKRAVELTLFTKKKYVDGELSDCELFEGDLRPAWSQEEQNTYEVIYILDPFCRNQALESVRKSLSHVYRLYEINPDFRIGQFFESEGDSEPYVVEAITRDAVGRPTPYEISVLREEDGKWDMLSDERRRLIGCMSSQNGQLLEFSRPVSVTASADPRVTKAHELGYTVCIADNTLETETVEGSSYLPAAEATGPELVVRVDGYAVRKVLADTVHVRFTEADGGERDDREAMREQARAVYDALGSSNRARLRLMGLVSDLKAGQLLESVTFDNGFDGLWRSPLELKAIAKVVRLRAHDNSTKVEVL
ncbi:MAG: hypothetical protein U5N86_04585 [Planctomycetota bacterium]|nr:hypothetical protein [Planctomycetota bacterium]